MIIIIVITVFICACFFIVFLNCYSAIRLPSRKCEIKLSVSVFYFVCNPDFRATRLFINVQFSYIEYVGRRSLTLAETVYNLQMTT